MYKAVHSLQTESIEIVVYANDLLSKSWFSIRVASQVLLLFKGKIRYVVPYHLLRVNKRS
jgi:hypothetical protein